MDLVKDVIDKTNLISLWKFLLPSLLGEVGVVEVLTVLLASNIFVLSVGVVVRVNEPHCLFMVLLPLKIIFSSREHLKQKFNVKIIFQAGQIWKIPIFSSTKTVSQVIFLKERWCLLYISYILYASLNFFSIAVLYHILRIWNHNCQTFIAVLYRLGTVRKMKVWFKYMREMIVAMLCEYQFHMFNKEFIVHVVHIMQIAACWGWLDELCSLCMFKLEF